MDIGKKEISFKPLTEGLGFHPFSDGMPYAPVAKSNQKPGPAGLDPETAAAIAKSLLNGAGATAAGQPRFSKAVPPTFSQRAPAGIGRVSVPVASASIRASIPAPIKASPVPQTVFGFGYLIRRLLAYCLDTVVNLSLCILGMAAVFLKQEINPDVLTNPSSLIFAVAFLFTFNWAMMAAQEVLFKTTVAKRIFGLTLQGGTAALFLRAFFFLPSLGFCGLGVIWSMFDGRKRCWHDHVVDLQPEDA